jgi:hypothetical protein
MQLRFKILIFALCSAVLFSCKEKVQEEPKTEIPEDFVEFYNLFHTDTTYQLDHIHFPLEGMPALSPDSDLQGFSFWWEREGWKIHKPFDDNGGTFNRAFSNFAGIITETISDDSGHFSMMRRFSKMNGEWMLIYYKEMGR